MQRIWKNADLNQDGKICFQEFADASSGVCDVLHTEEMLTPDIHKLHEQFLEMDVSGDGVVDLMEATRAIWAGSKCPIEEGDIMTTIAETMFAGVDLNGDGQVTFAEFIHAALNGNFISGDTATPAAKPMPQCPGLQPGLRPPGSIN